MKVMVDTMRTPAEPKPEFVECAIVELLEIAQRQGITPADFIQLLDSGVQISDFLAAMTPLVNVKRSIELGFVDIDGSRAMFLPFLKFIIMRTWPLPTGAINAY